MINRRLNIGLQTSVFIVGIALGMATVAAEQTPAKLPLCIACHGADGIGRAPSWPNLAGQKKTYLANQLRGFRDGVIPSVTMQPLVVELSDADIDELAEYYSNLACARP